MDFLQLLMIFASGLMSFRYIPQNYKVYKNKSARDFSYITIFIAIFGICVYIAYGISKGLVELWVAPIFSLFAMIHLLVMKIYYDNYYKQPEIETEPANIEINDIELGDIA